MPRSIFVISVTATKVQVDGSGRRFRHAQAKMSENGAPRPLPSEITNQRSVRAAGQLPVRAIVGSPWSQVKQPTGERAHTLPTQSRCGVSDRLRSMCDPKQFLGSGTGHSKLQS